MPVLPVVSEQVSLRIAADADFFLDGVSSSGLIRFEERSVKGKGVR